MKQENQENQAKGVLSDQLDQLDQQEHRVKGEWLVNVDFQAPMDLPDQPVPLDQEVELENLEK